MDEKKGAPDSSFLKTCRTAEAHVYCRSPVAKAMPRQAVNPVMARMSSKLPAAISKVGMPCSTPKPSFWSRSMEGTTTAGDTAPSTKLQSGGHLNNNQNANDIMAYSSVALTLLCCKNTHTFQCW